MDLEKYYKTELTIDQKKAVSEIEQFLTNEIPCFILKGYAGTGKTFLMKGLTDYLNKQEIGYSLMSPTGRAAKVLSKGTKKKAYTIHKSVYSFDNIKEEKEIDEKGNETYKFFFALKSNEENQNNIYIVDEASMVSDKYAEAEFFRFGSGYLLQDLIKYIAFRGKNQKILFIGDDAQLPPVNMNFSPALSKQYLNKKYGLESQEAQLEEVVRQTETSGILYNATKIRNKLKIKQINTFEINNNFDDIVQITHDEILATYLQSVSECDFDTTEQKINGSTVVICSQNSTAYEYNKLIRLHYFKNQPQIVSNDKIMVLSNNYNYEIELLNGDFGLIRQVANQSDTRRIILKNKNKKTGRVEEIPILLSFKDAIIRFWDIDGQQHDIKCKILENTLKPLQHNQSIEIGDTEQIPKSYLARDISSDEMKAIYIDAKIRFPLKEPAKKDYSPNEYKRQKAIYHQQFKTFLKEDPYFNALRIKFGYAITCHKAQGGEWQNPIVDFKYYNSYQSEDYFRWAYTALTRAKKHLSHFNAPIIDINSKIIWQENANALSEKITIDIAFQNLQTEDNKELEISHLILENLDLSQRAEFLTKKFIEIYSKVKSEGIEITNILHKPYLEKYTFQKDNEIAVLNFHFNGKNVFNSPRPQNQTNFELEICKVLNSPNNTNWKQPKIVFPENQKYLFEFFNFILSHCSSKNIIINAIQHNDFLERYSFRRFEEIAIINFDYNGNKIFVSARPEKTNSMNLLNDIKSKFA